MSPDQRKYQRDYYATNRERISRRRRVQYAVDPAYREQVKERAMDRYRKLREERVKARHGEPPAPPKCRGYNKPRVLHVDGRDMLVRSVREFADRVGRDVQTITLWEQQSIIPKPTVVDEIGRRWYADAHIELVARVAASFWREGGRSKDGLKRRVKAALEEAKAALMGAQIA
jgi:hypothetical protein